MGDQRICLVEMLPSALPFATPFFGLWAGSSQCCGGHVQGQGDSRQAPLAPLSRWSRAARADSSSEAFYGSSFRISQPGLWFHRRDLELIWSRVKACKALGVDGTRSLNSLFEDKEGKNPALPC